MNSVVEEQSPFNFLDFLKQRNRWQKAIFLNSINSPELSWGLKFFVIYNTFCFLGAPVGMVSAILY
jgi:cellulose synthase/poly-beta-1,6-N-acetylglucosamine synthase-like glycosyltransferase